MIPVFALAEAYKLAEQNSRFAGKEGKNMEHAMDILLQFCQSCSTKRWDK